MSRGTSTVNLFYPTDAGKCDANDEDVDYEFTKVQDTWRFRPDPSFSDSCARSVISTGYLLGPVE